MNNNFTNKPSFSEKKGIASWILGAVSILLFFLGIVSLIITTSASVYIFLTKLGFDFVIRYGGVFISTLAILAISFVLAFSGLIKGIEELKSSRKKSAIIGIVLSLIGLALAVYLSYFIIGGFLAGI